MSAEFLVVTTTVADVAAAMDVARGLVEAKLAACVQIVPIDSVYRWDGAVEAAAEQLLLCKIRASDFDEVEAAIRSRHAYDVPEILAVPVVAGSRAYLDWMADCTRR